MKQEEFETKINTIQEKIGKDASNLILDDIAILLTDNKNMNSEIDKKEEEITKLKQDKDTLQRVNGNLLQQVAMGEDTKSKENNKEEEREKKFNFRDAFDENRKF